MKTKLKLIAPGILLSAICVSGHAQGTAFTYQGRLNDGANLASGNYDLKFTLFGVSSGGSSVAGPLTNAPVGVSNGLFTVTLDFGSGVFTGAARWMEIGVRSNGSVTAYTTLSQRQQLTPTPYAIFAGNASNVVSGSVVQSLNGLKDNVTLLPGTNVTITPNGNTLTIASAGVGGSGIWSVNGNNTYYNAGKVGVGTTGPSGELTVATADDTTPSTVNAFDTRHAVVGTPTSGLALSYSPTLGAGYISALSPLVSWRDLVLQAQTFNFNPSGGATALSISNSGNISMRTNLFFGNSLRQMVNLYDTSFGIGVQNNALYQRSGGEFVWYNGGVHNDTFLNGGGGSLLMRLNTLGMTVNGKVGINSSTPISVLEVAGQDALGLIGGQPFLTLKDSLASYAPARIQNVNGDLVLEPQSFVTGGDPNTAVTIASSGIVTVKTLAITSDRNKKENFAPVSAEDTLAKVAALPISRWNFKGDSTIPHIGPMAQDFYAAFGVGADDKHIATVDEEGVALAAIQGLNQKLETSVQSKDAEIQELKHRLERLEKLLPIPANEH